MFLSSPFLPILAWLVTAWVSRSANSCNEALDATSLNKDITVSVCLEARAYSEHLWVTLDGYGLGRTSARDKAAMDVVLSCMLATCAK
jgi:hypothetical protein